MICAIHQPNFFSWLPYFRKVQAVDVFVILGEAQFSRDYYQHRFNIGDKWYTMPVVYGNIPIKDKKYIDPQENWLKIKRRLPEYVAVLDKFDDCISGSLLETNRSIIVRICKMLNIDTDKIRMDYRTDLTSNERLIDICKYFKCDTYLSGNGARKYVDEKIWADAGIKLAYQQVSQEDKRPILGVLCR